MGTVKMAVFAPKREGFTGVFAGGVHWPTGFSVRDVEETRVKDVHSKQKGELLKVMAVGDKEVEAAIARERESLKAMAKVAEGNPKGAPPAPARPPGVGPKGAPPAPPDVQLPTFEQYVAEGNTKGLVKEDAKASYELHLEAARDEAKRTGAKVLNPK